MTGKRKYNRTPQVFAITKRLVILSAEHERIRNTLQKKETDCRAPNGGLACRLGRCFCFAEVSTGHPHRNDRATAYCTHHTVFVATKRLVILSAEHERIRLPFKRGRIATRLTAVSPAGSVGASASQRCPPDTRTAMTERQLTAHTTRYSWQLKDLSF